MPENMILDVDVGNSLIKWRLLTDQRAAHSAGVVTSSQALFEKLDALESGIKRVRLCSVAGDACRLMLDQWFERQGGGSVEVITSTRRAAGVTNGYSRSSQLGVDRWLAICAGFELAAADVVVVDAGSALTLDFVTAAGRHCGGYIVPGIRLQEAALDVGTQQVLFLQHAVASTTAPGKNTQQAVSHGVLAMLSALIERSVQQFARECRADVTLLITGGDARHIGPCLDMPYRHVPDLVFQGFDLLLP